MLTTSKRIYVVIAQRHSLPVVTESELRGLRFKTLPLTQTTVTKEKRSGKRQFQADHQQNGLEE